MVFLAKLGPTTPYRASGEEENGNFEFSLSAKA
jgi:hypothetical protein